jgi:hypothetical protein
MGAGLEDALLRRFEPNLFHVLRDPDGVAIFEADCVIRLGTGQGHCVVTGTAVDCGAVVCVAVLEIIDSYRLSDQINFCYQPRKTSNRFFHTLFVSDPATAQAKLYNNPS